MADERLAILINTLKYAHAHRESLGEYSESAKAITELYGYVFELAQILATRGPSVGEAIDTLVRAKLDGLPEIK